MHPPLARTLAVLLLLSGAACGADEEVPVPDPQTGGWARARVAVHDGRAILGGDVDLGPVDSLRERARRSQQKALSDPSFPRWPAGVVPYRIEPSFERYRGTVSAVMRQWEDGTGIRFVPHTNEPRYVRISAGDCVATPYGTPALDVRGDSACIGHEIGHALGLLHEHQRADRAQHVDVRIPWWWVGPARRPYTVIERATPCGPYDLASIMHYDAGRVVRELPGKPITREDNVVSDDDRRAVSAMYRGLPCADPATGR